MKVLQLQKANMELIGILLLAAAAVLAVTVLRPAARQVRRDTRRTDLEHRYSTSQITAEEYVELSALRMN